MALPIPSSKEIVFRAVLMEVGFQLEECELLRFIETNPTSEHAHSWKKMEEFSDLNGFDDMLAGFKPGGDFFCRELPRTQVTATMIKKFVSLLAFMDINEAHCFSALSRNHALCRAFVEVRTPYPSNDLIRWMERINCPLRKFYCGQPTQPCPPRLICVLNQMLGIHDHQTLISNIGRLITFSDERLLTPNQKNIIVKAIMNLMASQTAMHLHDPHFVPLIEFNKLLSCLGFRARDINAVNDVVGTQPLCYNLVKQDVVIGTLKAEHLSTTKKHILIKVLAFMKQVSYAQSSDKVAMFPVELFWDWMESDESDLTIDDLL